MFYYTIVHHNECNHIWYSVDTYMDVLDQLYRLCHGRSANRKLYSAGKPKHLCRSYVMILSRDPPSNKTFSVVFFPTCTGITTIWWSIGTITTVSSGKVEFILLLGCICVVNYCRKTRANCISCFRVKVYLQSNTYKFMSNNTSFKYISGFLLLA